MVLVEDDNLTRLPWKVGRVIEVYAGRDGVVRSAKIKLSETTLIRSANKLYILENVKWNVQMISVSLVVEDVSTESWNNLKLIIVLWLFSDILLSYNEYWWFCISKREA